MTLELNMPHFEEHLAVMGFNNNPFPVVPDARHYVMTDTLRDISHEILFAISQSKGFVVVTGDVGVGKTTMSRYLINRLSEDQYAFALILNTYLQEEDLIDAILKDFSLPEINAERLQSKLERLNQFFLQKRKEGRNCVVIVDDAQNLSIKSLEVIRLLSNFETESEKLVQVLLIGQSELHETLNLKSLRQLKSRVVLSRTILPFSQSDLDQYVTGRLSGGNEKQNYQITSRALKLVYRFSRGNLRRTNLLLDRALLGLIPTNSQCINNKLIKECIDDITGSPSSEPFKSKLFYSFLTFVSFALFYLLSGITNDDSQINLSRIQETETLSDNVLEDKELNKTTTETHSVAVNAQAMIPIATVEDWKDYLQRFQLESLYINSWQAMIQHDYKQLVKVLESATGHRVSLLKASLLNELAQSQGYEIAFTKEENNLLLYIWKPLLNVNNFRIGQISNSIFRVQELLASFGFYKVPVDGQVGIKTIQALIHFQVFIGLPVSGVVDNETLFALQYPEMFLSY